MCEERKMILKTGDGSHDGSNQQQGAAMDVYTEWGLCKWQLKQQTFILTFKGSLSTTF